MDEPFSNDVKDLDDKDENKEQNKGQNKCLIIVLIVIIVILVTGLGVLTFLYIKKNGKDKDKNKDNGKIEIKEDEEYFENRTILFKQPKETDPAKHILVHLPEKEIFMSTLHPAASLYEDVTDDIKVKECFNNLRKILKEKNIELITVRSALKLNKTALKKLALQSLQYEIVQDNEFNTDSEEYKTFLKYTEDNYKKEVIDKLSDDQLVDVVLNNPKYELMPTNMNTFIEPKSISFSPLGNLIFCRDQQITTAKGVVIGRAHSSQRAGEHKIMKQVFDNINATVLGIVTEEYNENAYLEGGDFFVTKNNISMLGVGLRTSIEGAEYLMENDFLGTRYLAIIYDDEDLDQQRMHLDTYFNILSDDYVIVLDFDEVQTHYKEKKIGRKVFLYDNQAEKSININESNIANDTNIPEECGNYKLVKVYEKFYTFLEENGYHLIKVTHQQQVDYMINFLNIGNNEIISVNEKLKDVAKDSKTNILFLEFRPILNMYGAMHCITQVSRTD